MTNLFLLAGIGSTIANYSTSVIQGQAATGAYGPQVFTDRASLPSGWSHSELGTNYTSDPSLKFDTTSDSLFNTTNVIFGDNTPSSIDVTMKLKGNSLSGAYSFGIYALTSLIPKTRQNNSLATITSGISDSTGGTNITRQLQNITTASRILGLEFIYTTKVTGNIGFHALSVSYNYDAGSSVAVTSIGVSLGASTINSEATTQATANVEPGNATNNTVTWSSSNTAVATVDSSGLVTANSNGVSNTIKIRATSVSNPSVFGEADLTVNPVAVASIVVTLAQASIGTGTTTNATGAVSPANATNKTITWSSSNTAIATVNSSGVVTGVGSGDVNIIATAHNELTWSASLNVFIKTLSNITIKESSTHKTTFKFQESFSFSGLIINANYNSGTEEKTSGFTITGVNTSILGTQLATVTFEGRTTTYEVNVTNVGAEFGNDLFISEYIEGSGNNKYIEIYNPTSTSINLSDYKLRLYANGASIPSNDVTLAGTLDSGATVVYKNSSAALTLPGGVTATNNSAVNFSGDDALALFKISTSSNVDIFGKIGERPVDAWTAGGVSTLDKTLRRKSSIIYGVTTNPASFNPSLEWEQFDVNTVSGLGSHTINSVDAATQASAYGGYLGEYETCTVISTENMNKLIVEYNAMANESKTAFAAVTISDYDLAAYLANGSSYVDLEKTNTINALAKLDAIIARYNSANPGITVSRNAQGLISFDKVSDDYHASVYWLIAMITCIPLLFFIKKRFAL